MAAAKLYAHDKTTEHCRFRLDRHISLLKLGRNSDYYTKKSNLKDEPEAQVIPKCFYNFFADEALKLHAFCAI